MNSKLTFQSNSYQDILLDDALLKKFHSQFIGIFHVLPPKGKLTELVRRLTYVVAAPFVYIAWLYQICLKFLFTERINPIQNPGPSSSNTQLSFQENFPTSDENSITTQVSFKNIHSSSVPPDLPSKLKEVSKIKKSRFCDVLQELNRLRKNGIISPKIEDIINKTLSKISSYSDVFRNGNEIKMILGRALEIKRQFKDTHYVFTHGQSTRWLIVSCLIKELVKSFDPSRNVHHFKFLRTPQIVNDNAINDWKHMLAPATSNPILNDHNPLVREGLLSVDAHLFNAAYCESALNFLARNYSVMSAKDSSSIKKACKNILANFLSYHPNSSKIKDLAERMNKIAKKINPQKCGNLFVICVPKTMIDNSDSSIAFKAHPYGRPCYCEFDSRDTEILEDLQKDEKNEKSYCQQQPIPQYRLMTKHLKPENGVHTFLLTPLNKNEKKEIKNHIKEVAADAKLLHSM